MADYIDYFHTYLLKSEQADENLKMSSKDKYLEKKWNELLTKVNNNKDSTDDIIDFIESMSYDIPEDDLEFNNEEEESEENDFSSFFFNPTSSEPATSTYKTQSSSTTDTSSVQTSWQQGVVDTGLGLKGSKYTFGGSTPQKGFDCSGFINYIYKQNGINLNARTVEDLEKIGTEVPELTDVQKGDIICLNSRSSPSGKHVVLVTSVDKDGIHIVEAKGHKYGVTVGVLSNYRKDHITTIRRINKPQLSKLGGLILAKDGINSKQMILDRYYSSIPDYTDGDLEPLSFEEAYLHAVDRNAKQFKWQTKTVDVVDRNNRIVETKVPMRNLKQIQLDEEYIKQLENPNSVGLKNNIWTIPTAKGYDHNQLAYGLDTKNNKQVASFLKQKGREERPYLTTSEAEELFDDSLSYFNNVIDRVWKGTPMNGKIRTMLLGAYYRGDGPTIAQGKTKDGYAVKQAILANDTEEVAQRLYDMYKHLKLNTRATQHKKFVNEYFNIKVS